ncbi:hypothetical protein niasHT_037665 [Heterodera trifolii]|uniref:Uncharacterized protein n=1 Tax=Heterodera trifolii TaxID=157864 RepID=A0ABD2IPY2_9BILA
MKPSKFQSYNLCTSFTNTTETTHCDTEIMNVTYAIIDTDRITSQIFHDVRLFCIQDEIDVGITRRLVGYCVPLQSYEKEFEASPEPTRLIIPTEAFDNQFVDTFTNHYKFKIRPMFVVPADANAFQQMFRTDMEPSSTRMALPSQMSKLVQDKFRLNCNPHLVPIRLSCGSECFLLLDLAEHCRDTYDAKKEPEFGHYRFRGQPIEEAKALSSHTTEEEGKLSSANFGSCSPPSNSVMECSTTTEQRPGTSEHIDNDDHCSSPPVKPLTYAQVAANRPRRKSYNLCTTFTNTTETTHCDTEIMNVTYAIIDTDRITSQIFHDVRLFCIQDEIDVGITRRLVGYCVPLQSYEKEFEASPEPTRLIIPTEAFDNQFVDTFTNHYKFKIRPMFVVPADANAFQQMFRTDMEPSSTRMALPSQMSKLVQDKFRLNCNPHLVPIRLSCGSECFLLLDLAEHCRDTYDAKKEPEFGHYRFRGQPIEEAKALSSHTTEEEGKLFSANFGSCSPPSNSVMECSTTTEQRPGTSEHIDNDDHCSSPPVKPLTYAQAAANRPRRNTASNLDTKSFPFSNVK